MASCSRAVPAATSREPRIDLDSPRALLDDSAVSLRILLTLAIASCAPATPANWLVPSSWKHELIPFPLEFARTLGHTGVEELRFPPGFLDDGAPNEWSYVFVWRLHDPAVMDAAALGDALAAYFRGLLGEVDADKHRLDPAKITATATPRGDAFELAVHVIDTFHAAAPVDLVGSARRTMCNDGALWTFVLAPTTSPVRAQLDSLAASARCGQHPLK